MHQRTKNNHFCPRLFSQRITCLLLAFILFSSFPIYGVHICSFAEDSEIALNSTSEKLSGKFSHSTNLLVLGTDQPIENTKDIGRSDGILLFSLNTDTGSVRCISFERSIPVYVPEIYEKDMLTHVYHWKGPDGMVSTIEDYFDIDIDGYIQVDYESFSKLVDMIGGVDLELTAFEAEAMNGGWADVYPYEELREGINHMCGHDVLEYCRLRAIDDNYMRQIRQWNTAVAILRQAKNISLSEIKSLIAEFLPQIHHNLSSALILKLTGCISKIIEHEPVGIDYLQVPEKEYSSKYTMKNFSFAVQKERIRNFLQEEDSRS